jgi:hypothetical protein
MLQQMKRAFSFLIASLIGLMILISCHATVHPTLKVIDVFSPAYAYKHVVPYEVNLYGIYIFQHNLNWRDVERYILWYLDNLNYPDKHGLTGSMYDFYFDDRGRRTIIQDYDSVDAYAATFLILLREYYQKVRNRRVLYNNQKKIEDIAYLLIHLKDRDGLTRAVPQLDSKYLMDNCEVYAGLKAFVALSNDLGWKIPDMYRNAIDEVRHGILARLYDTSSGMFHWALDSQTAHVSQWNRFYPDAFAQLFPIIYGIVDPASPKARQIWHTFYEHYGMGAGLADPLQSVVISMARDRMCAQRYHGADGCAANGEK